VTPPGLGAGSGDRRDAQRRAPAGPARRVTNDPPATQVANSAADDTEREQEPAARAPGVHKVLPFDKTGRVQERELEGPAVGGRTPARPPPPAAGEAAGVGAQLASYLPVALADNQGRVERVVGGVAVVRIAERRAAGRVDAVEGAAGTEQERGEAHRQRRRPPAVTFDPVELEPPVAVIVPKVRAATLHHHPGNWSGDRRPPKRPSRGDEIPPPRAQRPPRWPAGSPASTSREQGPAGHERPDNCDDQPPSPSDAACLLGVRWTQT